MVKRFAQLTFATLILAAFLVPAFAQAQENDAKTKRRGFQDGMKERLDVVYGEAGSLRCTDEPEAFKLVGGIDPVVSSAATAWPQDSGSLVVANRGDGNIRSLR